MNPENLERRHDLDWLRVFAVALLIPFHTAMAFVFWNWHIKNPSLSWGLTVFNYFLGIWHMPLFFFLSGAATFFALGLRGSREYIRERVLRLLIPLVFGILVIVPPQIFFERLQKLQFQGNYFEFYPSIFTTGPYPQGNLSWHHLWFLAYLLVFSVVALPLFKYLRSEKARPSIEYFISYFERGRRLFLLAAPLIIYQVTLRVRWPNGNQNLVDDWANFLFYITVFALGYLICLDGRLWKAIEANRHISLALGITACLIILLIDLTGNNPRYGYNPANLALLGLSGFNTWCWIVAICGYGKLFLNRKNSFLKYTAEASFPVYILHQTAIVWIAYYIVQYNWDIMTKFTVINILSLAVTLLLYELSVKRVKILRFLFGMRSLKTPGAQDP